MSTHETSNTPHLRQAEDEIRGQANVCALLTAAHRLRLCGAPGGMLTQISGGVSQKTLLRPCREETSPLKSNQGLTIRSKRQLFPDILYFRKDTQTSAWISSNSSSPRFTILGTCRPHPTSMVFFVPQLPLRCFDPKRGGSSPSLHTGCFTHLNRFSRLARATLTSVSARTCASISLAAVLLCCFSTTQLVP